ncbi:MAG TPA: tetratricopeptide repeat protein [Flavobacteriales bacterium]|nr:tetratricopeptide repeat protein [Flavobacteriales bacterium]
MCGLMHYSTRFLLGNLLSLSCILFSCQYKADENQNQITKNLSVQEQIASLTKDINNDRLNPNLFHKRADLHLENKNLHGALNDISVAIKIDSTISSQYYTLSEIYFAKKELVMAAEIMKTCVDLAPNNSEALLRLAEMKYFLNDYKASIEYLKRVITIDKYNAKAFYIHGMVFKELGDTAKAVTSFQTAVENAPDYYEAYLQLGLLYYSILDPIALNYLDNAINLNPKSIIGIYTKAMYYQRSGDIDMAINTYYQLLDIDIYYSLAHYNLGHILYEHKDDYHTAIKHFSNAIKCDSANFKAYYMRGLSHEQLKAYKKAKADYNSSLNYKTNYDLSIKGMNRLDQLMQ